MAGSQPQERPQREMEKMMAISGRLVTVLDPTSAASEAYRALRTSLLFAQVDTPPRLIVVTSPGSAEGKSTVCANLGVVLAQAGKSILIIDCDFRRPVMHEIFGLKNTSTTYQCAIQMCFEKQQHRNVEAYVDDVVVKTRNPDDLIVDLEETFTSLWTFW